MNSNHCKLARICALILPRKLQHPYIWILACISALLCTNLYASDACYPDQYPFEDQCSTAIALAWETANPDEPIGNNSNKTIVVTGGVLPLTVQVEGSGFWLDPEHSVTSAEINTRSFTIYTSEACGSGTFSISDDCNSTTEGHVRSTEGQWVEVTGTVEPDCGTADYSDAIYQYRESGNKLTVQYMDIGVGYYPTCLACGSAIPICVKPVGELVPCPIHSDCWMFIKINDDYPFELSSACLGYGYLSVVPRQEARVFLWNCAP